MEQCATAGEAGSAAPFPADADPGIAVSFLRCAPASCFAEFDINDDRDCASGNGKVTYADVSGQDVVVPLSFSGFSQAFEALAKE
jgi:invasion protein IalB